MFVQLLETEAGSNRVGALERRGRLIGVVDGDTSIVTFFLGQGDVDRGTGADAVDGGGPVAVAEHTRLEDVTGTELEHLEQAILETEGIVVAQEGVGCEGGRHGEALVPLLEEEVVGETNVEASGKLHLGRTGLNGEIVAGGVDHLQGETCSAIAHRGTPVLEGDTELELVKFTGDILDTGIDAETGSRDVVGALSDEFDDGAAMDATGETVGIGHVDVHVAGREGTVGDFGILVLGDINVAEAHRHHIGTQNAGIEDTDTDTKGIDGSTAGEAATATIKHGVGIGHLDIAHEGKTGGVVEHSLEATNIGDVDTTPTGAAGPRIDEQLGGTRCSTTFIVAGLGRRSGKRRENHYYSKYS